MQNAAVNFQRLSCALVSPSGYFYMSNLPWVSGLIRKNAFGIFEKKEMRGEAVKAEF